MAQLNKNATGWLEWGIGSQKREYKYPGYWLI